MTLRRLLACLAIMFMGMSMYDDFLRHDLARANNCMIWACWMIIVALANKPKD